MSTAGDRRPRRGGRSDRPWSELRRSGHRRRAGVRREESYDVVFITVDMRGPDGAVVGSGTGTARGVQPGEPVEIEVAFSAVGAAGDVTCTARVELARKPV
jgi:hypothetical protein